MAPNLSYLDIISLENIFQAWSEFKKGKRRRKDVQEFERNLEDNLFLLYEQLKNKTYRHGTYRSFYVQDPKQRHIHKAEVRDRVVHHLLYKYLYNLFDKSFIYDSYSCREEKGTHKGVKRLEKFTRIVSKNYSRECWALKLDIKKFFASVDHKIFFNLLKKKVKDEEILGLLKQIINSFCSCHPEHSEGYNSRHIFFAVAQNDNNHKGIPLGNLTSQVFANIYMNELDRFIKHKLKIKYYLRYADDFVILSGDKQLLSQLIVPISQFLNEDLKLELHPKKIILRKLNWGIDFLGYIVLPHYILPRVKTKRRIFKKLEENKNMENFNQSLQSYLGYLSHASSYKLRQYILRYAQNDIRVLDPLAIKYLGGELF